MTTTTTQKQKKNNEEDMANSGRSLHFWSDEETEFMLLRLKESNIHKFMDGRKNRNGALFKKVEEQMASAGYKRTPEQIRVRWKNLKQAYFNARKRNQTNDHAPVSYPFSDVLEELLGRRSLSQAGGNGVDIGFSPPASKTTSGTEDVLDLKMEPPSPPTVEPGSPPSSTTTESLKLETMETFGVESSSTPALLNIASTAEATVSPVRKRRHVASDMDAVFERLQSMQASWMQDIQQSQDREERLVNSIVESNARVVSTLMEGIRSLLPSLPTQPQVQHPGMCPQPGIEDLCSKREELNRQIKQEEEEKDRLQHDIRVLSEKLSRVNESLAQRLTARATFDRTIAETEAAYTKILESSQSLLSVLKQEAGNLSKATEPRRKDH